MHVGVLRVRLRLFACRSLKDKRSVIKGLLARTRREFNVSAAELDLLDEPSAALLGFAHLAGDGRFSDEVLAEILRRMRGSRDYIVEDHRLEVM